MVLEGGYNKRVPPISAENALEDTIVPVSVGVSIVLMEVVSIDEVDHSIQLQFEVILNWRENRATYLNLKEKTALNKLVEEDVKRIWLPLIIYTNTDQKKTTRLGEYGNGEWSTTVTITREANFTRAGLDELDETEIFQGAENGLTMRQTYTHRFQCNYLLSRYPFDTQVCTIKMNVATLDLDTVKLIPKKLVMEQEEEMTIFHIIDRQLVYKNSSQPQDGVFMYIVLKRKITSEMMTTYFPTIMLTAITFATTFFKPYFFEAALTVNLTTMLVMTTIFISKMEGLPPTSATKMIDYWLILCQLVPFIQVVLVTALEFLRDDVLVHKHIRKQQKLSGPANGEQKEKTPFKMPAEEKPEEAWVQPEEGHTTIDPLTLLGAIGELIFTCFSFVLLFYLVYLVSICSATLSRLLINLFSLDLVRLLKTMKMFQNIGGKNFVTIKMLRTFLSEKKLMPMIVLSASIIYIGIAATFYFDLH